MNILLVTPYFPPQSGGVATYVDDLQNLLSTRGHRVYILQAGTSHKLSRVPHPGTVCLFQLYLRQLSWSTSFIRSLLAIFVYLIPTLWRLTSFMRRHQIELVSLEYPQPYMFYFSMIRWWRPVKLMVGLHGHDVTLLPKIVSLDRWIVKYIVRTADWVLAHSSSLLTEAEHIIDRLPICRSYLPYWVDTEQLKQQAMSRSAYATEWETRRYVLTVAKLYPRKGLDVLLNAIALMNPEPPHIFVIAGDGPEHKNLRDLADRLGIAHRVVFLGDVAHEEIPSLFRHCEAFVLPSREEPFGIVILEAMAFGKAIIASRVGGIPEFVTDGKSGLLVPSDDSITLAETLQALLADTALRQQLGQTASRTVVTYDVRAVTGQYEDLFYKITAGPTEEYQSSCLE